MKHELSEKDAMVAGIMSFVAAAKGQRSKDPEPKNESDIYFNAGFDLAIELAEKCAQFVRDAQ